MAADVYSHAAASTGRTTLKTFSRPVSEQFQALIEANLGPPPRDFKRNAKAVVQWLRPGMVDRMKHLRGEERLRHARLMAFE